MGGRLLSFWDGLFSANHPDLEDSGVLQIPIWQENISSLAG